MSLLSFTTWRISITSKVGKVPNCINSPFIIQAIPSLDSLKIESLHPRNSLLNNLNIEISPAVCWPAHNHSSILCDCIVGWKWIFLPSRLLWKLSRFVILVFEVVSVSIFVSQTYRVSWNFHTYLAPMRRARMNGTPRPMDSPRMSFKFNPFADSCAESIPSLDDPARVAVVTVDDGGGGGGET